MKSLYSWVCLMLLTLACQSSALAPMKEAATEQVPAAPTVPTPSPKVLEVCADGLNVRAEPMGDIKAQVQRGQKLELSAPVDGWAKITAGEWVGRWVNVSYMCELGTP